MMAYPIPSETDSHHYLYRQAILFYNEYERVKKENKKQAARIKELEDSGSAVDREDDSRESSCRLVIDGLRNEKIRKIIIEYDAGVKVSEESAEENEVYIRPECSFNYCCHPETCKSMNECQNPKFIEEDLNAMEGMECPVCGGRNFWISMEERVYCFDCANQMGLLNERPD